MSISMVLYAGFAASMSAFSALAPATAPSPAQTPAPSAATPVGAPSASGDITNADELLTRLETADAGLRTLTADIQYVRVFGMMGDRQVRTGALSFLDERTDAQKAGAQKSATPKATPTPEGDDPAIEGAAANTAPGTLTTTTDVLPPARRFAVRFNTVQVGSREERSNETYVFDGSVLAHTEPERRQITRYEIPTGDMARDPLKLGEGPLPLPIAQKREDILTRFDATLLGATDDLEGEDDADTAALHAFVAGSYQLKLVPKPEFADQMDASEIRLWYKPVELKTGGATGSQAAQRLLPRMAWTTNKRDDVAMVRLINVKVNPAIAPSVLSVDAVPEGFEIIRRQLAGPNSR